MENCERSPSPDRGHNQDYITQVCWLLPSFVTFAFKHLLIFITYEIRQLEWVLYQTWKCPEERTAEAADHPPSYPKNCLQPPAVLEVKNFETYYPQIVRLNNFEQFGMAIDRLCGLVVRVSGYRYRGPGFDPRRYQIFWVVVGLEWGSLSLVRSIEELLEWKSSGSRSRKQRLTAVGTRCADHVTPLYPQKLALTSPTGGGRSIDIVRVRTKATEFSLVYEQHFSK